MKNEGFIRGILMIVSGTLAARIVTILSIPILTRLYTPQDYGALSVFSSMMMVCSPLLSLRYCVALPLPKRDSTSFHLLIASFLFISVHGSILFTFLYFFRDDIFGYFSVNEYVDAWWIVYSGILLISLYELLTMWAVRQKDYKSMMRTTATQALMGEVTKVSLGVGGYTQVGLLIGFVVSQSFGIVYYLKSYYVDLKIAAINFKWSRVWFLIRYYSEYPKYRLMSQFLLVGASQAPLLFTSYHFGVETAGQLGLAFMAMTLPINLLGQSVAKAYYSEISALGKHKIKEIKKLTIYLQKKMLIIGIPSAVLVYFCAPLVFPFIFGVEWSTAGVYVSAMSFYMVFQLSSAPLMQLFNVLNAQINFLAINVIRGCILVSLFFVVIRNDIASQEFVSFYSFCMAAFYLLITVWVLTYLKIIINKVEK